MAKIPALIPITDLRQDAAAAIKQAKEGGEPIVITQRGRAAAVMIGIEAYERSQYEHELLLQLVRGEREIADGQSSSLDEVLAEVDRLFAEPDA